MPSGSHRTSGGSHRSGGSRSSFGSSSNRINRSSSIRRTSMRPIHGMHPRGMHHETVIIGGRPMGPVGSLIFFVLFLIIFSGMWFAGGIMIVNQTKAEQKLVEQNYTYYQDMITFAEQKYNDGDTRFIIDGIITGKYQSEYADKWYLTYQFKYKVFPETPSSLTDVVEGETYAIYDYEDIKNITPGSIIKLATYDETLTSISDTINLDYKNTKLEDDGYYISIKDNYLVPQIICFAVAIGSAALFISQIVKYVKEIKNGSSNIETEPMMNDFNSADENSSIQKKCGYCGSTLNANNSKCPNCNASNF